MADLSDQTEDTSPSSSDIGYTVKDPAGTPLPKKATWLNILKGAALGVLTSDGDLFTRTSGALARITRASLAADSAFSSVYLPSAWRAVVRKTADESVTSSATLQNDDHLLFAIGASEVWVAEFVVFCTGNTSGDIQLAITVPSGATYKGGTQSLIENATGNSGSFKMNGVSTASGTAFGGMATITGTTFVYKINAYIANSTNAGNVQLQWAQDTSNGTATQVLTGSYLVAHRIA